MRSVIGQLPMILGLVMAIGCALPGQKIGQFPGLGLRSKIATKPKGAGDRFIGDKLAFKSPERKLRSKQSDTGLKVTDAGESLDNNRTKRRTSKPTSSDGTREAVTEFDRENEDTPIADVNPNRPQVKQVNDQWSTDDAESPIQHRPVQLQELEFDPDEPSTPPTTLSVEYQSATDGIGAIPSAGEPRASKSGEQLLPQSNRPIDQTAERQTKAQESGSGLVPQINQTSHAETSPNSLRQGEPATTSPLPWQTELNQLIHRIEQDLAQQTSGPQADRGAEYLRNQAHLRLLYLMSQRQEDALTAIPHVTASEQEYWQQMTWALFNSLDTSQFPKQSDRAANTIAPLSVSLRFMRQDAPLAIKNLAFCRKISSFGNYEPFVRNEFAPGYEVLLYTEVENFYSSPTGDGEYRTSLKSRIDLVNSKGNVVWTNGPTPTEDFCRNPRRDYFLNYQFHIPEDLPTGAYTLRLSISDELSQKRVTNSLKFVLK